MPDYEIKGSAHIRLTPMSDGRTALDIYPSDAGFVDHPRLTRAIKAAGAGEIEIEEVVAEIVGSEGSTVSRIEYDEETGEEISNEIVARYRG